MHELTVVTIGVVVRDCTTGNTDSPWYCVPMKFYIWLKLQTCSHMHTYAHIHAAIHKNGREGLVFLVVGWVVQLVLL